jgi:hypothetical protein
MKIGGKARQSRVSPREKAMDPIINKFPGQMGWGFSRRGRR